MDFKKIKLIVFDLDGTLTKSRESLSEEVGEELRGELEKRKVAVISGAQFAQFEEQFLSFLPTDTNLENLTLLPTSGAQYYKYKNDSWQIVYDHSFNEEERALILKSLKEAIEESSQVNMDETAYGDWIEDRGAQITFSGLGQEAPLSEKSLWDPDRKKRTELVDILKKKLPDMSITIGGTSSVDITKKGIDKAYGIRELEKREDVPIDEMLYIGDALYDGGNDTPVIKTGVQTLQVSGPEEVYLILKQT